MTPEEMKRELAVLLFQQGKPSFGKAREMAGMTVWAFQQLLSGSKNIRFAEAVACAEAFGFRLSRINGSHYIYIHADIPELVNLQNVNGKAKPYQVKQLLQLIERYNLQMEEDV